jgi:hypothetical protein
MAMAESEETQVKGIVVILYFFGPLLKNDVNKENAWRATRLRRCLPLRVASLHFCRNPDDDDTAANAIPWGLLNFALLALGKEVRNRIRLHEGASGAL